MNNDQLNPKGTSEEDEIIIRFNKMLQTSSINYFESFEIEIIIDHYIENTDKIKLKKAFNLYEKLYPFSMDLKISFFFAIVLKIKNSIYILSLTIFEIKDSKLIPTEASDLGNKLVEVIPGKVFISRK